MLGENSSTEVSALRMVASSVGVVAGIGGLEHGFFELLQGRNTPSGKVIEAIGLAQRFWQHGSEPAFTLIPDYLLTGILATIASLMVITWAAAFIERKHGALVLLCLSIIMFLVGGGFAPPVCALLAIVAAAGMNRSFPWLRTHIPEKLIAFLSTLWKSALIAFIVLVMFAVIVAIFGYPLLWLFSADTTLRILSTLGNITFFGLGPIILITSLAYDIQKRSNH